MSNNYIPTTWVGGKTVGTANVMNNLEQGIGSAHDRLDSVSEQFNTKANMLNSLDWVNVVSLGVDNTNVIDCSNQINQIIKENQGKTIFMPKGNYKVLSPIIIDTVDLVCDGIINIGDNIGLNLTSSWSNVKIKKIIGSDYTNKKGIGLKVGSDAKIVTNSYVSVGMITECETGLLLNPNNNYGVQCSTFEFDNISRCTYGIKLQGGDNGTPWVNENKFICRGSLNCLYGIYSEKGLNMIDPYNGNKFINISIEQCTYPFVLKYMNSNKFENIRCAEGENPLVDYIFNLSNCNLNIFTSNIPNAINRINEVNCNNNLYDFIIQKGVASIYIGKSLKTNNNRMFLTKGAGISHFTTAVGSYNKTTNTSDFVQKLELINMSCDGNQSSILILDNRYGVDGGDYNEFIVDVQFIGTNGLIQIKNSSGVVLLDQTKLIVGKHLIKYIGGNWYSFKAN